jgi:RimJ/RimL family protein N-acetyltransferase
MTPLQLVPTSAFILSSPPARAISRRSFGVGRGIASQALSAFLFLEQRRPVYAGVAPQNVASMRVLQKCGFTLCKSAIDQEPELADDSHILLRLGETG